MTPEVTLAHEAGHKGRHQDDFTARGENSRREPREKPPKQLVQQLVILLHFGTNH
jgi:hypothetical protein